MNKEHRNSEESSRQEFSVQTRQVDGNLWIITKYENVDRVNGPFGREGNNLCAIFRSTILCEEDVPCSYLFDRSGKSCEPTIYNLETLMFISYRIALFEARAFLQWVTKIPYDGSGNGKNIRAGEVLITYNHGKDLPLDIALN